MFLWELWESRMKVVKPQGNSQLRGHFEKLGPSLGGRFTKYVPDYRLRNIPAPLWTEL
jgi:hypothetical protein